MLLRQVLSKVDSKANKATLISLDKRLNDLEDNFQALQSSGGFEVSACSIPSYSLKREESNASLKSSASSSTPPWREDLDNVRRHLTATRDEVLYLKEIFEDMQNAKEDPFEERRSVPSVTVPVVTEVTVSKPPEDMSSLQRQENIIQQIGLEVRRVATQVESIVTSMKEKADTKTFEEFEERLKEIKLSLDQKVKRNSKRVFLLQNLA